MTRPPQQESRTLRSWGDGEAARAGGEQKVLFRGSSEGNRPADAWARQGRRPRAGTPSPSRPGLSLRAMKPTT